jgi:hypothetical protein
MAFTILGRIVAVLAFAYGVLTIFMAFDLATSDLPDEQLRLYLGNKTTGQTLDLGVLYIVFSIVLGVLTDISNSVAKSKTQVAD